MARRRVVRGCHSSNAVRSSEISDENKDATSGLAIRSRNAHGIWRKGDREPPGDETIRGSKLRYLIIVACCTRCEGLDL
jgi:hypothetical protein